MVDIDKLDTGKFIIYGEKPLNQMKDLTGQYIGTMWNITVEAMKKNEL
jgi:hypothetical protein